MACVKTHVIPVGFDNYRCIQIAGNISSLKNLLCSVKLHLHCLVKNGSRAKPNTGQKVQGWEWELPPLSIIRLSPPMLETGRNQASPGQNIAIFERWPLLMSCAERMMTSHTEIGGLKLAVTAPLKHQLSTCWTLIYDIARPLVSDWLYYFPASRTTNRTAPVEQPIEQHQ